MNSTLFTRRLIAVVAGGALITLGAFTAACGKNAQAHDGDSFAPGGKG